jgi:hypothetical protein
MGKFWWNIKTMKLPENLQRLFRPPPLTWLRVALALAVAVVADGLQFLTGPLGWVGADQAIDVAAMLLTSWIIGFHWLLLPTFAVELVPVLDELPTWTACVAAVITLRKRGPNSAPRLPPKPLPEKPTIEI